MGTTKVVALIKINRKDKKNFGEKVNNEAEMSVTCKPFKRTELRNYLNDFNNFLRMPAEVYHFDEFVRTSSTMTVMRESNQKKNK